MIIPIACVAVIAAAGLGLIAGYMSKNIPATVQPEQAATAVPDGEAAPGEGAAASSGAKVADTPVAAPKGTETQYGAWVYSCMEVPAGAPKNCVARLAIRDKSRNITVINWLVGYNKDKKLLMEITTPVDVLVAPGLKMSIDDAPARPISLADLARESGLSRFQLVRAFARATGLTPHAYLMQRRIDLARRLIADRTPLAEAAAASGFADQAHMTRLFVRNYGVAPGAYAAAVA